MIESLRKIALADGRYSLEAFRFLFESLDRAVEITGRSEEAENSRHVTGQELLEAMREHARSVFGPLAAHVWRSWGIQSTLDWGHIVFLLVDAEMLRRRDSDTIEDFRHDFDFDEYFVQQYRPATPDEIGPGSQGK